MLRVNLKLLYKVTLKEMESFLQPECYQTIIDFVARGFVAYSHGKALEPQQESLRQSDSTVSLGLRSWHSDSWPGTSCTLAGSYQ